MSQGAELVPLEHGGEIRGPVTNDPANREQLKRNPAIQECGPLNAHLHPSTHADFVL